MLLLAGVVSLRLFPPRPRVFPVIGTSAISNQRVGANNKWSVIDEPSSSILRQPPSTISNPVWL